MKITKLTLFMTLMVVAIFSCKKKEGCTDSNATNYDVEAEKNCEACCVYAPVVEGKKERTLNSSTSGTGNIMLYKDTTYFLNGFVFVNSGQTLTIEAGTVIKGKPGQGTNASALIVARGGKINAVGTAADPIVFTFENDPLDGSVPVTTRGQWGGLIVLGSAKLNSSPGTTQIEGIPTSETRGQYGGTNDADNSGTLKYISIRHGGTDIGAGNEINGLTLGGVGSATTIDFVEVIANADDGIEFFGGAARIKHAIVAFCGDDSYDYDEGFRGYGQFWVTVQDPNEADRGGEHDGGTNPEDALPYAHPFVYNATYVGAGISAGKRALTFRDNAGGEYHNSIFYNWGKGIDVENMPSGQDAYQRFVDGELKLSGNVFSNVAVAGSAAVASDLFKITMGIGWATALDSTNELTASKNALVASFAANGNQVADAGLNFSFAAGGIDLIPNSFTPSSSVSDAWFDVVSYVGAFSPSATSWAKGWTLIDGHQPGSGSSTSYLP